MTSDHNAKHRLFTLLADIPQHRSTEPGPIGRLLEPREVDAITGGADYCEYTQADDAQGGFKQVCPPPDDKAWFSLF